MTPAGDSVSVTISQSRRQQRAASSGGPECGVSSEVSWQPPLYLQILPANISLSEPRKKDYKEIQTLDD